MCLLLLSICILYVTYNIFLELYRSCPRGLHCKDEVDVASTSLLITLVRVFSQIEDAEDILWVVKAITARLIDCKIDKGQSCDCEVSC